MLILLLIVGALSVNAQFGIRSGASFSSMEFESISTESVNGFYIGAFLGINITKKIAIRPEVNYVSLNVSDQFDITLDQLQIPILLQIGLGEKIKIMAGPSFGFLIDTADIQESFNYGIDMGASFDLGERFFIEGRYGLGLANLIEGSGSSAELTVNGFQVGAGFKF